MANVPNVPGVPRLSSFSALDVILLTIDLISAIEGFGTQEWGIFNAGVPAFEFNSVINFEYRRDWSIADYQVEEGGFQSYDKVQHPYDVRMTLVSRGTESSRQALLESIEQVADSLDLLDVVTPEKTYVECNISHFDLRRNAKSGVGIISVDVWLVEIRQTSTSTFTNTKSPNVAGQQALGNQQPQNPTSDVSQNFSSGLWTVQ